jgi:hypothetical protein
VVTGVDPNGKAVFVSDGEPERLGANLIPPGIGQIWGWESTPDVPTDGAKPAYSGFFPPPGGLRVVAVTILPESAPVDIDPADPEFAGLFTDADWDPESPGMHRSNTIDVGVVLDGSIVLKLDDGAETELHPGDWYVMNGTRHAWRNPHDKPCLLGIFLLGAAGPPVGAGT